MMSVEAYLDTVPAERKAKLESILLLIRSMYPLAIELMKYKMPTYEYDKGWVAVANQKSYISLYTCSVVHITEFKQKYSKIKTGKGCINFRDGDLIPLKDLETVIRSAIESGHG